MSLYVVIILFVLIFSEIMVLATRERSPVQASMYDRPSMYYVWMVVFAAIFGGFILANFNYGVIAINRITLEIISVALIITGIIVRWFTVLTLRRYYNPQAPATEHQFIQSGIYKHVRHPSYTGLFISFLGLALSLGNWFSLLIIMIPVVWIFHYRMNIEEQALARQINGDYKLYLKRTKKLIPFLY